MPTITRVKSKNIFSIGIVPVEIFLDKHQTTVLTGKNGGGKTSSIVDPICLALYNKPYRNINKGQCINSINNDNSVIEVDVESGRDKFTIIRGLKPVKFEIYKNGQLVDQTASARDYQDYLETIVLGGMNEKVFRQIVMMGSALYTPFMQLTAAHRREVIEELLDIRIFSTMSKIVKDKADILKEQVRDKDGQITIVREKLTVQKDHVDALKTSNSTKKVELTEKVTEESKNVEKSTNEINRLQTEKSTIVTKMEKLRVSQDDLKKASKKITILEAHLQTSRINSAFFHDNETCPTCKQFIEEDYKNGVLTANEAEEKKMTSGLSKLNEIYEATNKKVLAFETLNNHVLQMDRQIYKLQTDIGSSQRLIGILQNQISEINTAKNIDDTTALMKKYEDDLGILTKDRTDIVEEQKYYLVASKLLKDGGIKTKIIKQYIPVINKIVNEYLVRFGLPIQFTLDEEFNETIKSRNRDKFQYNNFSEGEKHRIDMALMLTWRKIAKSKNTINTNLLILDEVFDTNLDPAAADEFLNILLEMDKTTNIYIISHKSELSDKVDRVLEFEKLGNFTMMKEVV